MDCCEELADLLAVVSPPPALLLLLWLVLVVVFSLGLVAEESEPAPVLWAGCWSIGELSVKIHKRQP